VPGQAGGRRRLEHRLTSLWQQQARGRLTVPRSSPSPLSTSRQNASSDTDTPLSSLENDLREQRESPASESAAQAVNASLTAAQTPSGADATTTAAAAISSTPRPLPFAVVLWKFSRPHTLIGSAVAIPALHLLAAPTLAGAFTARALTSVLYAAVPSLLMNVYITGLNQISDVEIDRINKPYLVLPAGLLSRRSAVLTVAACLAASLLLGHATSLFPSHATGGLRFALHGSALLGTLYSLPPFRLKRSPLLAATCIVAVRGAVINASFYAHALRAAFGGAAAATVVGTLLADRRCLLSSLFFCVFGIVIALMKDVPDVRGDRRGRVRTFSVRLGPARVFRWSRRLLAGLFWAYGAGLARSAVAAAAAAAGGAGGPASSLRVAAACAGRFAAAAAAVWAGWSVRRRSQGVDPADPEQVYEYYMHLWKLFYGSYLALPFAR
jgi:homogentisate phytyltransferase/homogentisate geranylgeranyltransferase